MILHRLLTYSFLIVFFSCTPVDSELNTKKERIEDTEVIVNDTVFSLSQCNTEEYTYEVNLNNGYWLKFEVGILQTERTCNKSLYLMKDSLQISLLSETQIQTRNSRLGYISQDYDSLFLFVSSGGGQSQVVFDLIKKSTGESVLRGLLINNQFLEKESNGENDNFFIFESIDSSLTKNYTEQHYFIYSIKDAIKREIKFPSDIEDECSVVAYPNCLQLIRSIDNRITVSYYSRTEVEKIVTYDLKNNTSVLLPQL